MNTSVARGEAMAVRALMMVRMMFIVFILL
jgi:hypothetical protein